MHGPVEPGEPAQQAGHVGAAQRVADDRDEPAGQRALQCLRDGRRGAAVSSAGVSDEEEQWQGRLFRAWPSLTFARVLFCCPTPAVPARECAVDGFPPGEQAMPVVAGDDPREAFDIRARRPASRQSRPRQSATSPASSRPGQEAVLAGVHELGEGARVDRDDRQPAGHRRHGDQGLQLGLGRDGEHVGEPVQAGQVVVGRRSRGTGPGPPPRSGGRGTAACPRRDPSRPRTRSGPSVAGAVSTRSRRGEPGDRRDEHVRALLRAEPADRQR